MDELTRFDRPSLEAFARGFEALFYAGDHARMASFYTADAQLIAAEIETVVGRAPIAEFWRVCCAQGKAAALRRTIAAEHVERDGDLGWLQATVRLEHGAAPPVIIRDLTVWRREADGAWRIAVDISCASPRH